MIDLELLNKNMKKLNIKLVENIQGKKIGTSTKMDFIDNEGFKYNLSQQNIGTTIRRNGVLARYFQHNPYTFDNINNYLRKNNISLELMTKNPQNATCKLEFKCLDHNTIISRSWNSVKNGNILCSECENARKTYTYEEIYKRVLKIGCVLLDEDYQGMNKYYNFKCSCGNIFTRRLDTLLVDNVTKCHECNGINSYTLLDIEKELKEHDIELLESEYINSHTDMKIKYSCGFIAERTLDNIKKSDYKCPHCNKKGYKRNTKQFYEEVYELVKDEYSFYGEYINCDTKMKVKHNKCGHVYEVSPHKFINGNRRCPICNVSKNEEKISKYFIDNEVNFARQYIFDDLIGDANKPLRFDFGILNSKNELLFLLEYDGEYHYKAIEGEEKLAKQQKYDEMKNDYCKINKIQLIRIPYWKQDEIEEILNNLIRKGAI